MAHSAMATRFEFVLVGRDPARLRAAGEEAFDEVDRIEAQLTLYKSSSEIAHVNAGASFKPVRVSPTTFDLLTRAQHFWQLSDGAFDITVAPLVRCWGFMKGSGERPTDEQIAAAREVVGMQFLELDPAAVTVRFKRAGMMLDLGSIGKGYALDIAAEILRDADVENALLHGGTSTIYGMGNDIEGPWKIALEKPRGPNDPATEPTERLTVIELQNQAMSVSAVWGKFFVLNGKTFGHVIDPRTGWPAENAVLGCVVTDSAADSDALSTAVLLGDTQGLERISQEKTGIRFLQARFESGTLQYRSHGIMA